MIACQAGWQEYQTVRIVAGAVGHGQASDGVKTLNGTNSPWLYAFRPVLADAWPAEVLMDVFGTSGMTAYFGLRQYGPFGAADRIAVAAVTGSVGSMAAQLAKAQRCYVVGFAGGPDRCAWAMESLGIDECLDYLALDFEEQLQCAFPAGMDFYSDGVGGPLTELVARQIKEGGRRFAYGSAATYYGNELSPMPRPFIPRRVFGISEQVEAILRRKNIWAEAWLVDAFYHERLAAEDALSKMLRLGQVKPIQSVVEGFEQLPQAIADLYQLRGQGKLQVRFAR